MTEIPEHLLARSKARRAGAAAPSADAPVPATTAESAPATTTTASTPATTAPAPAAKAEPVLPWVEAAGKRRKIPVWAMSALVTLPIWAIVYATTNDPQSPKEAGPAVIGAEVYSSSCATCHGGAGGGGVGPAMNNGAVVANFPEPGAQLRWVMLGTAGFEAEGTATYGAENKPVGGGGAMPAQIDAMEASELMAVVRHERDVIGGEEFDIAVWETAVETLAADPNPAVAAKAEEFATVLEEWAASE